MWQLLLAKAAEQGWAKSFHHETCAQQFLNEARPLGRTRLVCKSGPRPWLDSELGSFWVTGVYVQEQRSMPSGFRSDLPSVKVISIPKRVNPEMVHSGFSESGKRSSW
jgi:hypothetical protein